MYTLLLFIYSLERLTVLEDGAKVTVENLLNSGWDRPYLLLSKEGLDMKLPPENFGLEDIVQLLGEVFARSVRVVINSRHCVL